MSNKQNINEIALSTAENIADELIFKSATTFIEDLAKSVPVASLALGLTKAISNYKTAKDQRQLLAFVQETENINNGFIEKFFKDKDNTELGYEILGILDQTYLEKQARMIGRTAVLFKSLEISKQDFMCMSDHNKKQEPSVNLNLSLGAFLESEGKTEGKSEGEYKNKNEYKINTN